MTLDLQILLVELSTDWPEVLLQETCESMLSCIFIGGRSPVGQLQVKKLKAAKPSTTCSGTDASAHLSLALCAGRPSSQLRTFAPWCSKPDAGPTDSRTPMSAGAVA